MIAIVQRQGGRGRRRTAPSSRSAGSGWRCSARPGTLARLRVGEPATAGHHAGGPRGLAHPVRLRRRRRADAVRAAADRQRRRAAAGAGHAGRPPARTRCAARCRRGPEGAHQVPGIGKKGAERLVLELRDRLGADSTPADGRAAGRRPDRRSRRGATRSRRPWSGWAGRRGRPTRRSPLVRRRRQARRRRRRDVAGAAAGGAADAGPRDERDAAAEAAAGAGGRAPARATTTSASPAARTTRSASSRRRCGRSALADFIGQPKVREQLDLVLEGAHAPRPAAGPRAALRRRPGSARPAWP